MNIIFLSRKHGRPMTLQLKPRILAVAAVLFVTICVTLGVAGYHVASRFSQDSELLVNRGAVDESSEQLKAMAARMSEMQARLTRLDALGEHLAESANLKSKEFDFSKKPPMGGPLNEDLLILGDRPSVQLRLQELAAEIDMKEAQLEALDSLLAGRKNLASSYLANMPVRQGYMTSRFGYRSDPFTGRVAYHGGIDFAGPEGTDVYAVAGGVVTFAGVHSGYGNMVEVNHGGGISTRYAHARNVVVKAGDIVSKDQLVAYMGSTGRSTGPHLHYEVLKGGKQVDPATYIAHAKP